MQKTLIAAAVMALISSTSALAADAGLKGVGVTLGSMGNPFFATLAKGAEDKAKELGGSSVKAVSYTHLDVYKRQSPRSCRSRKNVQPNAKRQSQATRF